MSTEGVDHWWRRKNDSIRTRFSYMPGHHFDISAARVAIANYCFAKKNGGSCLFRVDDIDRYTLSPSSAIECVKWLGIMDVGPFHTSFNVKRYSSAVEKLILGGFAYPDHSIHHRGMNRNLPPAMALELYNDTGNDVRLKIDSNEEILLDDLSLGTVKWNTTNMSDPIIFSGDYPSALFSEIIDDLECDVTHVIRAENRINDTPIQLLVAHALDKVPPFYAHIPVLLENNLIKTTQLEQELSALKLPAELTPRLMRFYKEFGYEHKVVLEYICGRNFELKKINNKFDYKEIKNLNSKFIAKESLFDKTRKCMEFLKKADIINPAPGNHAAYDRVSKVVDLCGERLETYGDIVKVAYYLFRRPKYNLGELDRYVNAEMVEILQEFNKRIKVLYPWDSRNIRNEAIDLMKERRRVADGLIFALCVSIRGRLSGPCIFKSMELLERSECHTRIKHVINQKSPIPVNWGLQ